jgi:hypothetical protein
MFVSAAEDLLGAIAPIPYATLAPAVIILSCDEHAFERR